MKSYCTTGISKPKYIVKDDIDFSTAKIKKLKEPDYSCFIKEPWRCDIIRNYLKLAKDIARRKQRQYPLLDVELAVMDALYLGAMKCNKKNGFYLLFKVILYRKIGNMLKKRSFFNREIE